MSESLIGSAYVDIKPTPASIKAFPGKVKGELEASLKKPIPVPVEAKLLAFKRKIQAELRTANLTVAIGPALTPDFRTRLEKLVLKASAGLTVPVNVVPTGKGGAAGGVAGGVLGGTGTGGGRQRGESATATQRLKNLTNQRIAVEAALARTVEQGISVEEKKRRVSDAVRQSENLVRKATLENVEAQSLKSKKLREGFAAEQQAIAGLQTRAAAERDALIASEARAAAQDKAAAKSAAVAEADAARVALAERLTKVDRVGAGAATATAAAKARSAEASEIAAAASRLHDRALKLESESLIASTSALNSQAAAEERAALAAEKAAAASARRAKTVAREQSTFARGAGATGLTFLGARGATLAASHPFLAGAAAAVVFGKAVQTAAKLQEELNVFSVTAQASAQEMERVSQRARELGVDLTLPAVSANDAAQAMTELSKAGLNVQNSMDAARGTLQLATAAQLDNQQAVELVSSALNAFGLAGNQAVHVADLLAGAANAAQGGIADMGVALQQSSAVARQAGLSIEDTVAMLTLLARNGLRGSDAGTSLRTAILRLIAPTKDASALLKEMNIQVRDFQGNLRPEVFDQLANALREMSKEEGAQVLRKIFGQDAIRAAVIFGREGAAGLNSMRDATNQAGAAAELAGARTQGFSGKVEALKNSADTLALSLGQLVIGPLGDLVDVLADVTTNANKAFAALNKLGGAKPGVGGKQPKDKSFFGSLLTDNLFKQIKQLQAASEAFSKFQDPTTGLPIRSPGSFGMRKPFEGFLGTANRINKEIGETLKNVSDLSTELNKLGAAPSSDNEAIQFLEDMKRQIFGTGRNAEELRAQIDGVIRLIVALGRAPTAIELKTFFEKGELDKSLEQLIREAQRNAPPLEIKPGFAEWSVVQLENPAKRATRLASERTAELWATVFGNVLPPELLAVIDGSTFDFSDAAAEGGTTTGKAFADALQVELSVALATPGTADDLPALRAILARRQRIVDIALAKVAKNPTEKNRQFLERARELRDETQAQIDAILNEQESARKERASKIATARSKHDQDLLDAVGLGQSKRENAILVAEGSERLSDDIKTHTELRDFLVKSREDLRKKLQDPKTKAEAIANITKDIISENQTIKSLQRQLIDSLSERFQIRVDIARVTGTVSSIRRIYAAWLKELKAAYEDAKKGSQQALALKQQILQVQQDAFDAINESFELDISFAQATDNKKMEIRAREKYIAQLQREQAQYKRGTLEWKRIRNAIAEQKQAIKDARGEMRDLFHEMSFEFLTRQQGFAATVMSNLLGPNLVLGAVGGVSKPGTGTRPGLSGTSAAPNIGSGPAGGRGRFPEGMPRVGLPGTLQGKKPPSAFLGDLAGESAAGARGGTPSQFATIIHLLQQMVTLLAHQEARGKHPNNRASRGAGGASLDTM